MKLRIWCLGWLTFLLVLASTAGPAWAADPGHILSSPRLLTAAAAEDPVTRFGDGYRFKQDGWIFVHIQGEPAERGAQHGYLLAQELAELLRVVRFQAFWDTGIEWSEFVIEAERQFAPRLDAEFLDEIKGIASGAQQAGVDVTWQDVLAWNGLSELETYWSAGDTPTTGGCSAFIATGSATKDGKIVLGHNTWTGYTTGGHFNLLLDVQPSQGHRIFMQAYPGYIHSFSDYFVTDAGIMGAETTIGGFGKYDPNGTPEFFRMRKATQYADTLDDWVDIMLAGNSGGYANSWLLGDANSGEIMRFELGLRYHSVDRTQDGYYIGFNAANDIRLRRRETTDPGYDDIRTESGARRVRLTQLMTQYRGQLDVETGKLVLADHYDVYLEQYKPGSRTVEGRYDLDRMEYWDGAPPFSPDGAVDGKVMDSDMARTLSLWARWGSSSGLPFDADAFVAQHPQYDYLSGYLRDRPAQPWSYLQAGQEAPVGTASSTSPADAVVRITADDMGHTVELGTGQILEVVLEGNPTAGYLWELASVDNAILRPMGPPSMNPLGDDLGTSSQFVFRFLAATPGQTPLELVYHRSWATEAAPGDTFAVQVVVKDGTDTPIRSG